MRVFILQMLLPYLQEIHLLAEDQVASIDHGRSHALEYNLEGASAELADRMTSEARPAVESR